MAGPDYQDTATTKYENRLERHLSMVNFRIKKRPFSSDGSTILPFQPEPGKKKGFARKKSGKKQVRYSSPRRYIKGSNSDGQVRQENYMKK